MDDARLGPRDSGAARFAVDSARRDSCFESRAASRSRCTPVQARTGTGRRAPARIAHVEVFGARGRGAESAPADQVGPSCRPESRGTPTRTLTNKVRGVGASRLQRVWGPAYETRTFAIESGRARVLSLAKLERGHP